MLQTNDWSAGAVLCGYRLVRPLAVGGMGAVWAAEQTLAGRRVAVKVVAPEHRRRADMKARLLEEARLLAMIEHECVVRVLDVEVTSAGDPVLVMELLDGGSLAERVHDQGPLSIPDVRAVLVQASAALDAVHHAGLLHLDVKADNIMLMKGPALRLKLIDFGLARSRHATEASFEVDGTPEFMSPEQMASCDSVDERSDTFGLAVCLYHALTGAMPFAGTGIPELWVAISRGELHPASSVRAELRPAVDHFFTRALAYDKGARFSGTADMQSAFFEATDIAHVPTTRVLPMVRPRLRSTRAWIVAMVCVVAAVGVVVFLRTGDRPSLAAANVPLDPTGERLDAGASDAHR